MKLFKRCQIHHELAYLALTAFITWTLLFVFMAHSSFSKYSHLVRDYDLYRERIRQSELSAVKALDELKAWKAQTRPNRTLFDHLINTSNANDSSTKTIDPYMCAAIMSKKRIGANVNLAAQSIAALLTRTQLRYEPKIQMILFNVEANPAENEFLNRDLNGLIKITNVSAGIKSSNLRLNEAMDYALVFKTLASMSCSYSLILEDDAIISHNWFPRLQTVLDNPKLKNRLDWSYMKLFTGYKLFDWDWLWHPIIMVKVLMLAVFLHIVQYTLICKLFPKRFSSISYFLVFANSVALVVVFNAMSVNPVGAGVHEYTTGFGTVSVLIPRHKLEDISKFLMTHVSDFQAGRTSEFKAKDLLLDEYRKSAGEVELVFEPSLVQHIGYFSSVYMRDLSVNGYKRMFKSFSFMSHFRPIQFEVEYFLS